MNFFGHYMVARHADEDPAYILGSMLPDFASMSGARLGDLAGASPRLRAGVAMHHVTDAVFHSSEPFVRLCGALTRELEESGVRRGTSMAVGHIGVELLLDRWLLGETDGHGYLSAIDYAIGERPELGFGDADKEARFDGLMKRLASYELGGYEDISVIVMRLERALSGRKRLALLPGSEAPIFAALERFDGQVAREASPWLKLIWSGVQENARFDATR